MPRRSYPVRARRQTVWVGTANQAGVAVGSGLSVLIGSFAPDTVALLRPTLIRTRGIGMFSPTAFSVDLAYGGAYGLGIVSDDAFAAGAGSIPRPFDDDDWPGWVVHGYYTGRFEFDVDGNTNFPNQHTIDSKAMRKVGPNEVLVWMVESQQGAITADIKARMLFKLS